ncbi:Glutaredoxin domain protein [Taphrina deformans PYCC 5710]|uniref:Glutaredoxin domain protein n=1 Tax=Taphrina deformans (strain PYCC 5710 / ATCC 11124 / CBS 356.35 / IMI 108563 / JCM 9778 / NBRC 8474) TaxID=1097556 RepID=R4X6Z8_TAPDE|nr:Glutaredoxin domain protein [Taphrina deformans PYCC 5710]|eukprot:CCG81017.1 Glutaredoxin domain protein [Taphrina deformans PYCC 5710]
MTSDLKPRTRSKKRANVKLYVVLTFALAILYYFFFAGSAGPVKVASPKLSGVLEKGKSVSAASAITKGIAGTSKDKPQPKTAPEKAASQVDRETHELVHELKIQAAGEATAAPADAASTKISGPSRADDRESYLTTTHDPEEKEVIVKTTDKTNGRKTSGVAYNAADALKVLFESYDTILFSKSYCPHSKKAKEVLELYDLRPKPLIYELDIEDNGAELQKALSLATGRSTVPNMIVHGQSIGGGDEIVALDKNNKLVSKIRGISDRTDITRKERT